MKRLTIMVLLTMLSIAPLAFSSNTPADATPNNWQSEETISLDGLSADVTVKFDAHGIPHIYGDTDNDIARVQGYLAARDRFFQMDWMRHQGQGRLSELVGESQLGFDWFMRTLGLNLFNERDLAAASDEDLAFMQAFSDGVNAYIADKSPEEIAVEYGYIAELFGEVTIEPWEPLHSVATLNILVVGQEQSDIMTELRRFGVVQQAGPLIDLILFPSYPYDELPVIGGDLDTSQAPSAEAIAFAESLPVIESTADLISYPLPAIGSNSWAVSGDLTESGMPIMANDPHIGGQTPAIWWQAGVHCNEINESCGQNAYGFALAAIPGVFIGHNDYASWGLTNAGVDTLDIYLLEINPDDENQYMLDGEWMDMDVREEVFPLPDGSSETRLVRSTVFGPVINHLVGFEEPMSVAFSTAFDANLGYMAPKTLGSVQTLDDLRDATLLITAPSLNVAFATADGDIGALMIGSIPDRVDGHTGDLPTDGSVTDTQWEGVINDDTRPSVVNPPWGYVVAANNPFYRPEDYPTNIYTTYGFAHRPARAIELIEATDTHTMDSLWAVILDSYEAHAPAIIDVLLEMDWQDETLAERIAWLGEWDYQSRADSGQAAFFNAIWMQLATHTFDEYTALGEVDGGTLFQYQITQMIGAEHPLWNNAILGTNDRFEILRLSANEANAMLEEMIGDDHTAWRWDAIHIAEYIHIMQSALPADDPLTEEFAGMFTVEVGIDGGLNSLNRQQWSTGSGSFRVSPAVGEGGLISTLRMTIDFSDFDNSRFSMNLGQSGHPDSPHFSDLQDYYTTGAWQPYGFTPDAVDALTERVEVFSAQ